jgi:short-subunit dehydrogenase
MNAITLHNAIITGASSGIGLAIALALASVGRTLWLLGRSADALRQTALAVEQRGGQAHVLPGDFAYPTQLSSLTEQLNKIERVDALLHCAGGHALGGCADMPVAHVTQLMQTNFFAPWAITQALLPQLKTSQGHVGFINSSVLQFPRAQIGAYAASKAALKAMADCLRQEVNPAGIRVFSILLGKTASPMQAAIQHELGQTYRPEALIQPEDVANAVLHALSLPRNVELTDIYLRPAQPPG